VFNFLGGLAEYFSRPARG